MGERVRHQSFVMDSARWDGFPLRPDDIIISTPSKSGTTWTQMICALLLFDTDELPAPLTELSPWLDMQLRSKEMVFDILAAQQHRRFIKTHTPLDSLPLDERVTYVCVGRDPRDVSLSWENHMANIDMNVLVGERAAAVGLDDVAELGPAPAPPSDDPRERFWTWAEPPGGHETHETLPGVMRHLQTFWDRRHADNVLLLHYSDMSADLPAEMRRLADALHIEISDSRIEQLAVAASFDRMKAKASDLAPVATQKLWRDDAQFFNKGTSGQWRELLDADDRQRYAARVSDLAESDLAAWAHGGRLGDDSWAAIEP